MTSLLGEHKPANFTTFVIFFFELFVRSLVVTFIRTDGSRAVGAKNSEWDNGTRATVVPFACEAVCESDEYPPAFCTRCMVFEHWCPRSYQTVPAQSTMGARTGLRGIFSDQQRSCLREIRNGRADSFRRCRPRYSAALLQPSRCYSPTWLLLLGIAFCKSSAQRGSLMTLRTTYFESERQCNKFCPLRTSLFYFDG